MLLRGEVMRIPAVMWMRRSRHLLLRRLLLLTLMMMPIRIIFARISVIIINILAGFLRRIRILARRA
jgi:hypothetical protein